MGIYNTNRNDYRSVDGTETVTLRDLSASTNTSITNACREPLTNTDIMTFGIFRDEGTVWHLADVLIATANKPVVGDRITDSDSTVWYIVSADKDEIGANWRCVSKKGR